MSQNRYAWVRCPARQRGAALVVGLVLLVVITLVGVGAMQTTTLQEKMAGNLRDSNLSFQAAEAALRHCEGILRRDYLFQVASLNLGLVATPPQARPLDQIWQLDDPATVPVEGPSVWIWSLDEDQAAALFPGLAANRLDAGPNNNRFWWVEPGRGAAWWITAASNSQALPANTLDGLIADPRCIFEAYTYRPTDNTPAANAFRRNRQADGVVVRNDVSFRRERNYYRITARGVGGSDTAVSMLQTGIYRIYHVPAI
jgi:Tfp pilus assembly protein PilX